MCNSMILNIKGDDDCFLAFEICGETYQLSEYDQAIHANQKKFVGYYKTLKEFPYSIKSVTKKINIIRNAPVFIIYRNNKISIYDFLNDNKSFENQLSLSEKTNGLEVTYDLELAFRHIKNSDDYHSVIYETFRIIQDLHFLIATARWALIQAHRILHFRSGLIWENGWEQLWTRATWLNNAIVLYDSCFDKLIQAIWIGTEGYKNKRGLNRASLFNVKDLEELYKKCWRRDDIDTKIIEPYRNYLTNFHKLNCSKQISGFAQKIKHRGGMRYDGLFPFGQISIDDNIYDPFATRNTDDIDDVVNIVKEYHIEIIKLADIITSNIVDLFKQNGYLSGKDIKL